MKKVKGLIKIKEFPPLTDANIKNYQKTVAKQVKESFKKEKELTVESIEGIVDIKHHLWFMEAKNNKDAIDVDQMVLRALYNFFKIEGYNESHLSMVIYNESFEYKGIKY